MSAIVSTEAIVLQTVRYGESSKIVTFYSREFGKLAAIAKGARRSNNKFASALEPMSRVSVVVYKKDGREVQTLSQCDLLESSLQASDDLDRISVGWAVIELMRSIAHEEERNTQLYDLLAKTLSALNVGTKNFFNVLYYFEIQSAGILGFRCSFGECISCGRPLFPGGDVSRYAEFHLDKGGACCNRCHGLAGTKVKLSRRTLESLDRIAHEPDPMNALSVPEDEGLRNPVQNFLWSYLKFHVTGVRPLKSTRMFSTVRLKA